jgi:hypothetical protein
MGESIAKLSSFGDRTEVRKPVSVDIQKIDQFSIDGTVWRTRSKRLLELTRELNYAPNRGVACCSSRIVRR